MLRRIVSKFYRRLPIVRELQAIVREHHKITASIAHVENYVSRVEKYLFETCLRPSQTVRVIDFDLCDHPRYGDPLRLFRYQSQVCSQNGEDGIIHEIFRRIGTTTRIFVEVGVGNGCENNTAFLLSQAGPIPGADETQLLLELLREECGINCSLTTPIEQEANELIAIFTTIIRRTAAN